jgi:glycerophosphoryl diester phosphodiesterase
MLIIGHRGASAVAPENTIAAFERAMLDGADGVEFDVRLASDSVPVVIHDATLRRTALRDGSIAFLSSTELATVGVGEWFNRRYPSRARSEYVRSKVPTLVDVLEFFKDSPAALYVEMKSEPRQSEMLAARVAKLIKDYNLYDRAVVESFSLESIRQVKQLDPAIRTAALFEPRLSRPVPFRRGLIEKALAVEADEIALHRSLASGGALDEASRRGLKTVVWTADHPAWIQRARRHDIHAIITNVPARLSQARAEQLKSQS